MAEWGLEAGELVARLERRGITLRVEGPELVAVGPRADIEDEAGMIRRRKLDLIAYVNGDHSTGVRRLPTGEVMWLAKPPPDDERHKTAKMCGAADLVGPPARRS